MDNFEQIIESVINGQRSQAKDQFLKLSDHDKYIFLVDYLEEDSGYHTSTRKICLKALLD